MSILDEIEKRARIMGYTVPALSSVHNHYSIGVSGGLDSSALAIVMKRLFPDLPVQYVFTDTKAEDKSIYESLKDLQKFLDVEVTYIAGEKGLFDLVEGFGGFLPSQQKRYCTRLLKIIPYENWVKSKLKEGEMLHSFVGIRADEEQRHGLVTNNSQIKSFFPFQDLGLNRDDILQIMKETIGIPSLYAGRSRSGCSICPFMRKAELFHTLKTDPEGFDKAMSCERLTPGDEERYRDRTIPVTKESRLALNHLTLPFPERADLRSADDAYPVQWNKQVPSAKRKKRQDNSSANEWFKAEKNTEILWVGAELYVNSGVGDHGVWWQDFVTMSTTRNGLFVQMKNHYQHRLNVPEIRGLNQDEMKNELRLIAYAIEVPIKDVDASKPSDSSYTWQSGFSLAQLKQYNSVALRTLQVAGMDQEIESYKDAPEMSWQFERREGLLKARNRIKGSYGRVLAMDVIEMDKEVKKAHCTEIQQHLFEGLAA